MAQTHSPTRSFDGIAEHRRAGTGPAPATLISAMSVSGSEPTTSARRRAAVGQLHREPLGAFDHVVVGQDVAVGVDQEAGAGAAPRRVAAATARVERIVGAAPRALFDQPPRAAAAGRGVDVHDRGIQPRGDVRKVDGDGASTDGVSDDLA